jgi:hypothetical protein
LEQDAPALIGDAPIASLESNARKVVIAISAVRVRLMPNDFNFDPE